MLRTVKLDTFLDTLSYRWSVKNGEKEWIKVRIYKDLKGSDSMATTKEYKKFILEQLDLLDHITCRPMMGGYLI